MKPKGRPKKARSVNGEPKIGQFSPRGRPGRPDEISLTIDQFEAIRLADYSGMMQIDASKQMKISRQTFGRILKEAHKNVSDGIVNGKIIKFEGGNINIKRSRER